MMTLDRWIRALGDEDPVERMAAAREIGKRGPDAASAAAAVTEALEDEAPMVRAMAAAAAGKIGAEEAVPRLAALLEDPVFPVRFWAADALGRLGAPAREALAALERRWDDEHKAVRNAVRIAVRRLRALES